ncbi:chitinase [Nonomuraea pusilla]|uniref:chitinase n=1 Tax=Nonomuraea pusilla TaxID=46177 RepID=A0A1H7VYK0_9ACTN|nr:cellulose binding domain-containing protein [Nonomuraea pusilla]SEM14280.1 Chitinase [Nonomuraea pusilla]
MKARAILLALVTLALGLTALPAHAAAAPTATFVKVADWGSGFEGKVTVTNGTSSPLAWNVQFDVPSGFTVPSAWDAVMTRDGGHYTFTPPSWAGPLAPGASTSFGFNGNPGGFPGITGCTLNGSPCGGSDPGGGLGKPGPLTLTSATQTSATVSWPAVTGATGYKVAVNGGQAVAVTGTSHTLTGLTACTGYTVGVTATATTGDGPPSDPLSFTTPGCATGTLPKHFLTGYWHNFVNAATELRLSDVPAEYDLVAVAFGEATATPGQVAFTLDPALSTALGGYTDAQFKADIQALHRRGAKVILSVGGEAGRVQVASTAAAGAFADSVHALMTAYGFDGVDIDLENGLNATYMAQALRSLRAKAGADLIITMAPQTIDMQSTGAEYFKLALSVKDILTVVHTQFYNSGPMLGCDQRFAYAQGTVDFMTALACIQLENGLRPDQVALGLPAGPGAAGGGVVSPSLVNQALDCLATRTRCGTFTPPRAYPDIRGAMTWSVNWDASANWSFSKTVKPHLQGMP